MVAVPVCYKDFCYFVLVYAGNFQLPLRAFTAINKYPFVPVADKNSGVIPVLCGHHRPCPQKNKFHTHPENPVIFKSYGKAFKFGFFNSIIWPWMLLKHFLQKSTW